MKPKKKDLFIYRKINVIFILDNRFLHVEKSMLSKICKDFDRNYRDSNNLSGFKNNIHFSKHVNDLNNTYGHIDM